MIYVAQGALDAYVEYGLHCWDMAAAAVIVTEAGGQCSNPDGKTNILPHLETNLLSLGTKSPLREK